MANFYRGKLRKLITDDKLIRVLESSNKSASKAAAMLSNDLGVPVSRQNVEYWRKQVLSNEVNAKGKPVKPSAARVNRALVKERVTRIPSVKDYASEVKFDESKIYKNILVMPDLHAPYHHKDSLDFMKALRDKYQPDLVVNLGDEIEVKVVELGDVHVMYVKNKHHVEIETDDEEEEEIK